MQSVTGIVTSFHVTTECEILNVQLYCVHQSLFYFLISGFVTNALLKIE